jgi:hypothetical protein
MSNWDLSDDLAISQVKPNEADEETSARTGLYVSPPAQGNQQPED